MSTTFGGTKRIVGLVTERLYLKRSLKTRAKAFKGNQGVTGVCRVQRIDKLRGDPRDTGHPETLLTGTQCAQL